jgi:hypothetical protein
MKPNIEQIAGVPKPTEAQLNHTLVHKGGQTFGWEKNAATTPASETQEGVIELATVAEILAGIDAKRAVTPAGLKAHSDQEKAERNQAILAALQGAVAPDGSGVSVQYVTNAVGQEATDRNAAIAAAIGTEITARDVAIAMALAAAKAYTDSKVVAGGTGGGTTTPTGPGGNTGGGTTTPPGDTTGGTGNTGGGTTTPSGGTVPERAMRDRSGSPIIDRNGNYIEYRIPIIPTPTDTTGGTTTPPPVVTAPANAYLDRTGSPIVMRDGTYLLKRTAPDPVVVVQPDVPDPVIVPPVVYPTTQHIRLESVHSHAIIEYQDGLTATIRLVRPMYEFNGFVVANLYGTTKTKKNFFYGSTGPDDLLAKSNEQPMLRHDLKSEYDGILNTQFYMGLSDDSFAQLDVKIIISDSKTNPNPVPTPSKDRSTVILFDDFLPGTYTGCMPVTYGDVSNTGNSTILLKGRASCMSQTHPDRLNTDEYGYPNGLYEYHMKFFGDLGNAGGPLAIMWPASNVWPGPEIDMGEFFSNGTQYVARHWLNADGATEKEKDGQQICPVPSTYVKNQFNTWAVELNNTSAIFYMNGVEFFRSENIGPPPKDFKNGGENHTIGMLSGSDTSSDGSATGVELDWFRFTPTALIGVDPATLDNPPAQPTNPTLATASIVSVVPEATSAVGDGTLMAFTINTTGFDTIGYTIVDNAASGYKWLIDPPIFKPTTGALKVNLPISNGQFVKAIPPTGYDLQTYSKDSPAIQVIATGTGSTPPTTGTGGTPLPAPSTNVWYEDFSSNTKGQLTQAWGETSKISFANGEMKLAGSSAGVGVQMLCNGADKNFGNGYYEIRAKMTGGLGSGSGPALVLWPSSNVWPGPEIDIAEINAGGQTYYTVHYRDSNGQDQAVYTVLPNGHDYTVYHTYGALIQNTKTTFYLDGKPVGSDTSHPAPDFLNGGENHSIGVMNRSIETTVTVDWMRFTPEANILAGTGPIASPAVITPQPLVGDMNILLRGQSNALLMADRGGLARLRSNLQTATGKNIYTFASWGTTTGNTINSGSAFMDWEGNGMQTSFLQYINSLTAAQKARPTLTLWMHNEYEQKNMALTAQPYADAIRSDAVKVRNALGQPASKTPYLFASIRYNYGNNWQTVYDGWAILKNDPSFNAYITHESGKVPDIIMDGDGYPNSSHMGDGDALRIADLLTPVIKNIINAT